MTKKILIYGILLLISAPLFGQESKPSGSGVSAVTDAVIDIGDNNPIKLPAMTLYPEIVAEVNGERITREDLVKEVLKTHGETVLERMLHRALILAECKRQNINITQADVDREIERFAKQLNLPKEQFMTAIKNDNNMTPEQYASEVIWPRLALEALVYDKIQVSPEELEKKYLSTYGPSVALLMILVDSKEKAEKIRAEVLANPASFGDVAKKESIDVATASNKGRMQPVFQYSLPDEEMEKNIFAMNPGDISNVIGPYGPQKNYIIFKCENKYDSIVPADKKEALKDQLLRKAKADKLTSAAQKLFEQLGKDAKVVNILKDQNLRAQYPNLAATVNDQPIYLTSVIEMSLRLYAVQDLEAMISRRLIEQECQKVKLNVTDKDIDTDIWIRASEVTLPLKDGSPNIKEYLDAELVKYEVPLNIYRSNIVKPGVQVKKLSIGLVKVTDEDIQKGFEATFGPKMQCLGIIVGDERRARDVWQKARTMPAKLNKPLAEVFGDLAAQYSIEPGSKQMKGRISPIIKNGGEPKLEAEAFSLKPGDLSSVIQIDPQRYVILYCQEIIPAKEVKLEQVRDSIYADIKKKKEVLAINKYYSDVMRRATIMNYVTKEKFTPQDKTIPIKPDGAPGPNDKTGATPPAGKPPVGK